MTLLCGLLLQMKSMLFSILAIGDYLVVRLITRQGVRKRWTTLPCSGKVKVQQLIFLPKNRVTKE